MVKRTRKEFTLVKFLLPLFRVYIVRQVLGLASPLCSERFDLSMGGVSSR